MHDHPLVVPARETPRLAEDLIGERRSRGVSGVVRIVDAQLRNGDELDRAALERILRVHDAAGLAELVERRRQLRARSCKRRQVAEDAAEPILAQREGSGLCLRCARSRHRAHADAGRERAGRAQRAEKSASTDRVCRRLAVHRVPCRRNGFFDVFNYRSSHVISPRVERTRASLLARVRAEKRRTRRRLETKKENFPVYARDLRWTTQRHVEEHTTPTSNECARETTSSCR